MPPLRPLSPLYRDFDSVPFRCLNHVETRLCRSKNPIYSLSPAVPEEWSWKLRRRGLDFPTIKTASANTYMQLAAADSQLAGPDSRTGKATSLADLSGMGVLVGTAGTNYMGIPLTYEFSTADASCGGPSKPVRCRSITGVRTWPGRGCAIPPKIVVRSASASAGVS